MRSGSVAESKGSSDNEDGAHWGTVGALEQFVAASQFSMVNVQEAEPLRFCFAGPGTDCRFHNLHRDGDFSGENILGKSFIQYETRAPDAPSLAGPGVASVSRGRIEVNAEISLTAFL